MQLITELQKHEAKMNKTARINPQTVFFSQIVFSFEWNEKLVNDVTDQKTQNVLEIILEIKMSEEKLSCIYQRGDLDNGAFRKL